MPNRSFDKINIGPPTGGDKAKSATTWSMVQSYMLYDVFASDLRLPTTRNLDKGRVYWLLKLLAEYCKVKSEAI